MMLAPLREDVPQSLPLCPPSAFTDAFPFGEELGNGRDLLTQFFQGHHCDFFLLIAERLVLLLELAIVVAVRSLGGLDAHIVQDADGEHDVRVPDLDIE